MSEVYTEYKTNVYTKAMGCVRNADGSNVFDSQIPLSVVRERFALEHVESYPTAYVIPGTDPNGLDDVTVIDNRMQTLVKVANGRIHGRFDMDTERRQYEFLYDLATGVTGESLGDLHVTAAGTTRNGGRAYIQLSTAEILSVAGMDYAPFLTIGMSHDGSLGISSATGVSVIACANMVAGIFGASKVKGTKVRQTRHATDLRIITAHQIALGLERSADDFDKAVAALYATTVTDKQWATYVELLAPITEETSKTGTTKNENVRGVLNSLYVSDARCAPWHGTALGALQAVNTFDLWERAARGDSHVEVRMTDELLSGKLAVREANRAELLQSVLVAA